MEESSDHEKAVCEPDCTECGKDRSKHFAQFLTHEYHLFGEPDNRIENLVRRYVRLSNHLKDSIADELVWYTTFLAQRGI